MYREGGDISPSQPCILLPLPSLSLSCHNPLMPIPLHPPFYNLSHIFCFCSPHHPPQPICLLNSLMQIGTFPPTLPPSSPSQTTRPQTIPCGPFKHSFLPHSLYIRVPPDHTVPTAPTYLTHFTTNPEPHFATSHPHNPTPSLLLPISAPLPIIQTLLRRYSTHPFRLPTPTAIPPFHVLPQYLFHTAAQHIASLPR